jgi:hypothetical protein
VLYSVHHDGQSGLYGSTSEIHVPRCTKDEYLCSTFAASVRKRGRLVRDRYKLSSNLTTRVMIKRGEQEDETNF